MQGPGVQDCDAAARVSARAGRARLAGRRRTAGAAEAGLGAEGLARAAETLARRGPLAGCRQARFQPRDDRRGDRLGGEALDAAHHAGVAALGQGDGHAVAPSAAGAADAVHVVLGLHRQAVVDDVGDARHVDAARGHVGGHQNAQVPHAQGVQHAGAAALRHAAVQRGHGVADLRQLVGHFVGVALGGGEHHGLVQVAVGQQVFQQLVLVQHAVGPVKALFDLGVGLGVRVHRNALRVAGEFTRQVADVAAEGGAEHHGLALGGQGLGDEVDVVDEAHVQHAVGFVQHQGLHAGQHGAARTHQVHQAAGRGDQDVQRAAQCLQLRVVGHTAHHAGHAQALHAAAIGDGGLGDLLRQFTRGRQHQHARAADLALWAALGGVAAGFQDALQRRQHKGGGLAAAGLGRHQQVAALQGRADRGGLHRGGLGVAGLFQSEQQFLGQAQLGKGALRRLARGRGFGLGGGGVVVENGIEAHGHFFMQAAPVCRPEMGGTTKRHQQRCTGAAGGEVVMAWGPADEHRGRQHLGRRHRRQPGTPGTVEILGNLAKHRWEKADRG